MLTQYNVLIFGAGQIAAGYDTPDSALILTHAHAINEHRSLKLLGFYDVDADKAEQAVQRWGGQFYKEPVPADIISICTPDKYHLESIYKAAELHPKLIILEKPIARSLEDARRIIETAGGIPVQVNFTRRFVCEFQNLAASVFEYGAFLSGSGLYGKGFIHNGSHMIDLLRLLLGEITAIETLLEICDFYDDDATKTVKINFERGGEFFMKGIDCRFYTIFELDLCFEKARIRILDSGERIQIYHVRPSQHYEGYKNLVLENEYTTELNYAMRNLYQNVFEYLTLGTKLILPLEKAFTEGLYTQ